MPESIANSSREKDIYVYFMYSEEQYDAMSEVERKLNRTYIPGTVINKGMRKRFTEISKTPTSHYPDAKVVAEGYKSKMVFTNIQKVSQGR